MKIFKICFLLSVFVSLNACSWLLRPSFNALNEPDISAWPNTQFSRSKVNINEFYEGGIPKDGIPPIDHPQYISQAKITWLLPQEPVIVLQIKGVARAYPLQIMLYHEIVNDVINGHPVSITFCPLCNSAIVFDRRLGKRVLDFGTTGLLRKSDLVMYDRQTESWWQQFGGQALVGELTGAVLKTIDSQIVAFKEFQQTYPNGKVLSRDTGFKKPYGKNYIMGYDKIDSSPFYYTDKNDTRLRPMERVLGVTAAGINRIYPFTLLKNNPVINDEINGVSVVIFYHDGMRAIAENYNVKKAWQVGAAMAFYRKVNKQMLTFIQIDNKIFDQQTHSQWNMFGQAINGKLKGVKLKTASKGVHFSFAWFAFLPDSEVYGQK